MSVNLGKYVRNSAEHVPHLVETGSSAKDVVVGRGMRSGDSCPRASEVATDPSLDGRSVRRTPLARLGSMRLAA